MNNSLEQGWIEQARRVPSPNFGPRPAGVQPDLLVIHNISLPPGEFGNNCVEQLFSNCLDWDAHPYFQEIRGLEVSSHLFIRRCGELLQFVSLLDRAWHAGQSCFEGRDNCNDFSIGIELEGTDDLPYSDAQYASLVAVTRQILHAFPGINPSRITGHSDIAPGRKTDPGPAFDWSRYLNALV
ncbi:1,6-anhydro-N-acetylmuramyl-L-alanine amidase AmpD [Parahaliea sp. F7430]|uniref:1,6-anhydro-N-acetylmuramyl-L-alanine amidase AmpD n=1 Tax=Sediminihaliea albiluteola TaxID=2758564 RepID=A0A7W2TVZ1_9GAMM|nr:1,6-anhydro-N-acetylmuramyl-L-alanine amidase AmpD [Sediminihaliea albiluteola]MBA6412931.1 1,6-anhydro-N-acetylmuramyl-L-alanine amidase AmpD [Sediminihaliea albiluteola]